MGFKQANELIMPLMYWYIFSQLSFPDLFSMCSSAWSNAFRKLATRSGVATMVSKTEAKLVMATIHLRILRRAPNDTGFLQLSSCRICAIFLHNCLSTRSASACAKSDSSCFAKYSMSSVGSLEVGDLTISQN